MDAKIKEISTFELEKRIKQPNIAIVDLRPVDAYNGWKLKGEKRGGHIQGARCLPFKWTKYMDWIEIVRAKGILPSQSIVIYSYSKDDSLKVAMLFTKAKYTDVSIYNGFVDEWSVDEELPMDHLKKYKQLVSPQWLNTLLSGGRPPEYSSDKYVLLHAHYRNRSAYDEGHIPGAVEVDTNTLESPETWNRRTPEELEKRLSELGITKDTTVILYGRFSYPNNDDPFPGSSAGHLGSIRSAFILMYAGVKDVRVLNGGLQSWQDEGFDITKEEVFAKPVKLTGLSIPERPELAVDVPEAKELIAATDGDIVCVRSWPEYIGEVSGYNYIEKTGRIKGTVFGNCGSDAYHMENYRNLDHTTREYHEIEAIWKEVNLTPDKHLAFYCGTGWRGSEAFFNAWLMGWPRVSVFDGGWFEWSNDPDNPTETGLPQ